MELRGIVKFVGKGGGLYRCRVVNQVLYRVWGLGEGGGGIKKTEERQGNKLNLNSVETSRKLNFSTST